MNMVRCTSKNCGVSDTFDDALPDGWMYVKADPPPAVANPKITIKSFRGVCPGCVAAQKQAKTYIPGGTEFKPHKWGEPPVDRQKTMFD